MQVVKILRKYKRIKQYTIAEALKMDRTCYGRLENGIKSYTPSQLKVISNELQVSMNDILDFVHQSEVSNLTSEAQKLSVIKYFSLNSSSNYNSTNIKQEVL